MKVEDKPLTMPPAEKTEEVWQPENDFRTSILRVFQPPRPAARGRQEIARFPATPALPLRLTQRASRPPDRASVSPSVRSVSNSVRQTTPPVSTNVRRKSPLIARRAVHHCAPLQLQAIVDLEAIQPPRGYGRG